MIVKTILVLVIIPITTTIRTAMTIASVTTTIYVSQVVVSTDLSIVCALHACLRRVI